MRRPRRRQGSRPLRRRGPRPGPRPCAGVDLDPSRNPSPSPSPSPYRNPGRNPNPNPIPARAPTPTPTLTPALTRYQEFTTESAPNVVEAKAEEGGEEIEVVVPEQACRDTKLRCNPDLPQPSRATSMAHSAPHPRAGRRQVGLELSRRRGTTPRASACEQHLSEPSASQLLLV